MKKILLLHYVMLWMGQIGIVLDQSPNWKNTRVTGNKLVICIYLSYHSLHPVVLSSNKCSSLLPAWSMIPRYGAWFSSYFQSFLLLHDVLGISLFLLSSVVKCIANLVIHSTCSIYLHWRFVIMESMSFSWHLPSSYRSSLEIFLCQNVQSICQRHVVWKDHNLLR